MGLSFEGRRKAALEALGVVRPSRDVMGVMRQKDHMGIYNTARWARLRDRMRLLAPCCPDPFGDHPHKAVQSAEVHHIIPLHASTERAFDPLNAIALCRQCHARADELDRVDADRQRELMFRVRLSLNVQ
jgi:5-methylcytosine-specific restriction endonuclease McrA